MFTSGDDATDMPWSSVDQSAMAAMPSFHEEPAAGPSTVFEGCNPISIPAKLPVGRLKFLAKSHQGRPQTDCAFSK